MIYLAIGVAALVLMYAAAVAFARASVGTVKIFGIWLLSLIGVALMALLLLSGRGGIAFFVLPVFGPLLLKWLRGRVPGINAAAAAAAARPRPSSSRMTRSEALEVLGLSASASRSDIQAAYVRLMRAAHPDSGGSDWLAARINQARDTLLG